MRLRHDDPAVIFSAFVAAVKERDLTILCLSQLTENI